MKETEIKITVQQKQEEELTSQELLLLEAAKKATYTSYAPYSHFSVGAAALLDDGTIVEGSNQENCAYPSGLCAERTALFYANSQYPDRGVLMLCIAARGVDGEFTSLPVTPCGACRQVMLETEKRYGVAMKIMLYGTQGIYFVQSAGHLMPLAFEL